MSWYEFRLLISIERTWIFDVLTCDIALNLHILQTVLCLSFSYSHEQSHFIHIYTHAQLLVRNKKQQKDLLPVFKRNNRNLKTKQNCVNKCWTHILMSYYSLSISLLLSFCRHAINACIHVIKHLCVRVRIGVCLAESREHWCCDFIEKFNWISINRNYHMELITSSNQQLNFKKRYNFISFHSFVSVSFISLKHVTFHSHNTHTHTVRINSIYFLAWNYCYNIIKNLLNIGCKLCFADFLWNKCCEYVGRPKRGDGKEITISHFNDNEQFIQNHRKYLIRNSLN